MKKTYLLVIVLVFLSIIAQLALAIGTVYGATKEIRLVDEKGLKLSYIYEEKTSQLQLKVERASDDEHQRLKLRVTDEKDQALDYPKAAQMIEKDEWLIEEDFSAKQTRRLTFDLEQSVKQLQLYVQIDQEENSEKGTSQKGAIQKAIIQEDILDNDQPFIIDLKKETVIGPKKEEKKSTNALLAKADATVNKMYEPLYSNKHPQYTTDVSGTYPAISWQPENQINVINHQGGNENQSDWDNVKSWNVAADDHTKSYIKYGEDETNPNISIRKYAQQTDKADEFKIKLNIRGNVSYEPGVDLVFLLDNSASMNSFGNNSQLSRKKNTEAAFAKIIEKLEETYPDNKGGIRIGSHIFSDYEGGYWGELPSEKMTFPLSASHTDWDNMVSEYKRAVAIGYTFTQRGLREAGDVFLDAPDSGDRYKLLFVLTDGAPNRSWTPKEATADPKMYFDPYYITTFSGVGSKGNYNYGSKLGATGNQTKFPLISGLASSHITTTNSTAKAIKENEGVEIHTIGVNIEGSSSDHSTEQLKEGLYRMSTKKANTGDKNNPEDYFYYDVSNPDELTEVFKNWYETIIRTVDNGIVTDPLGDMVDIVEQDSLEETVKISQVSNGAAEIDSKNMPITQLKNDKRTIHTSNINLTGGQEIEIEYIVKLKTDSPNFVSSQWYPANKTTTLEPTPERTTDKIEFGSPSVRCKKLDFVIPVEKVWLDKYQETDNYWEMRTEKVTVVLQKQNGHDWEEVEVLELDAAHEWKGTFSPVEGGKENTYRVIEPIRTTGYLAPIINQAAFTSETILEGGIKVTNELLRGSYSFNKFMEDGATAFTDDLPKFKITRSDGKLLANDIAPNAEGKVQINELPVGDYTVEETYVPQGFQKMANFTITVTENAAADAVMITVNDLADQYTVINKLKDFSLKVNKVDSLGEPLTGVSFTLTGPSYEETQTGGPEFIFTRLRPGRYTLAEVENPEGYQRLKEPIQFAIAMDGTVTITAHPEASGSGGVTGEGNTISIQVTNKPIRPGVLPSTGVYGVQRYYLAAGILMSIGVLISLFYAYYNRKQ